MLVVLNNYLDLFAVFFLGGGGILTSQFLHGFDFHKLRADAY